MLESFKDCVKGGSQLDGVLIGVERGLRTNWDRVSVVSAENFNANLPVAVAPGHSRVFPSPANCDECERAPLTLPAVFIGYMPTALLVTRLRGASLHEEFLSSLYYPIPYHIYDNAGT